MSAVFGAASDRRDQDLAPTYRITSRTVADGQEPCSVILRENGRADGVDLILPHLRCRHAVGLVLRFDDQAALDELGELLEEARVMLAATPRQLPAADAIRAIAGGGGR